MQENWPKSTFEKHKHYDSDLEAAILGACLLEKDAFGRIKGLVEEQHFYYDRNKAVFRLFNEMWNNGMVMDVVILTLEVYKRGLQKSFGEGYGDAATYITKLTNSVTSTASLETHALYLRQLYIERESLKIQMEAGKGNGLDRMLEIQEMINQALTVKSSDDWLDMSEIMIRLANHRERVRGKEMLGITTGFPTLDNITSGFEPGQLIVIGARPSVGKSALAGGIAVAAARQGHTVGIISLEMPSEQIAGRLASFYSSIEFWRIYRAKPRDEEQERIIMSAMSEAANLPIFVSDKTNVTGSDIRAKAYKLKKRHGLGMLIVDYLQLIETEEKGSTREREVAKLSRSLKLLAMDLGVPVIALAQLNRESEKAAGSKPRMSNIRESGALEQDADGVILLHRDWKSGIQVDENGHSTERQADLIVEKWRNGTTTSLKIAFDPETMRFYEESQLPSNFKPVQNYYEVEKDETPF